MPRPADWIAFRTHFDSVLVTLPADFVALLKAKLIAQLFRDRDPPFPSDTGRLALDVVGTHS